MNSLTYLIESNEILRHIARGSYSYAWFRTKELVMFLSSYTGSLVMLWVLASLVIGCVCFPVLYLGAKLNFIVITSVYAVSKYVGASLGIPLAIYWFFLLLKLDKESMDVCRQLVIESTYRSDTWMTKSWEGTAEAYSIFANYSEKRHDPITIHGNAVFAGPSPSKVTPAEIDRLEELGWYRIDRLNCFCKYY
jgi:hypothetical protein